MPYVRTVKTKSGATAVQVVWSSRRGSRSIEHIGSAHDEPELEALKAAARQKIAAGQPEPGLGLATAGPGGPLPVTSTRMGHLLDALDRGYRMEPKFPALLTDGELRAIHVPVLLITGARSALLTPEEARARASLMPHAQVAIVPGSHGGFDRIDELNDQIAAFIQARSQPGK